MADAKKVEGEDVVMKDSEIEAHIMSPTTSKTQSEWWAHRRILELESESLLAHITRKVQGFFSTAHTENYWECDHCGNRQYREDEIKCKSCPNGVMAYRDVIGYRPENSDMTREERVESM